MATNDQDSLENSIQQLIEFFRQLLFYSTEDKECLTVVEDASVLTLES